MEEGILLRALCSSAIALPARGAPHRGQRQAHPRRYMAHWGGWRSATHRAALRRFRSRMATGRTGDVIGGSEPPPGTSAIGASPAAAVTKLDGARLAGAALRAVGLSV